MRSNQTRTEYKKRNWNLEMARTWRILSIDGGGIRGIIPAVLLRQMEERTGYQISDLFDFVTGTSTGAIIALGLTTPVDAEV